MPSLKEILQLLVLAKEFAERLEEIWREIENHAARIKDEKKRAAILDACGRRDPAAVRRLLFD